MRRELLVAVAVGLLGGALLVTGAFSDAGPRIVGARVALPAGTRLTLGDLQSIERPPSLPPERAIRLERASAVLGKTLAHDVEAGAPLTLDDLRPPGAPRPSANRPRRPGAKAQPAAHAHQARRLKRRRP